MYGNVFKLYALSKAKSFEQVTVVESQLVSTEAPVKNGYNNLTQRERIVDFHWFRDTLDIIYFYIKTCF